MVRKPSSGRVCRLMCRYQGRMVESSVWRIKYYVRGVPVRASAHTDSWEDANRLSRHEPRQKLAREFGATDIVTERGDEGVARIKELNNGIGADAVLECVGTQESMTQAIHSTRSRGSVGYVGVRYGVELNC